MHIIAVKNSKDEVINMVACYTDLRDQMQTEQQIHQLAFYDALTGLPNRAMFLEKLRSAQKLTKMRAQSAALLLLEWDDFKAVNETFGYAKGDQVLNEIGQRLTLFCV
ncbi:diguanylate cyclase domain-containing protein [Orrella sp. 11846]|uniref:diguanylate cyclase domain-containing protein n=1 Tax=Orrella sp. 11846 TaxID=3409913 RepID=UPI003B5C4CF8